MEVLDLGEENGRRRAQAEIISDGTLTWLCPYCKEQFVSPRADVEGVEMLRQSRALYRWCVACEKPLALVRIPHLPAPGEPVRTFELSRSASAWCHKIDPVTQKCVKCRFTVKFLRHHKLAACLPPPFGEVHLTMQRLRATGEISFWLGEHRLEVGDTLQLSDGTVCEIVPAMRTMEVRAVPTATEENRGHGPRVPARVENGDVVAFICPLCYHHNRLIEDGQAVLSLRAGVIAFRTCKNTNCLKQIELVPVGRERNGPRVDAKILPALGDGRSKVAFICPRCRHATELYDDDQAVHSLTGHGTTFRECLNCKQPVELVWDPRQRAVGCTYSFDCPCGVRQTYSDSAWRSKLEHGADMTASSPGNLVGDEWVPHECTCGRHLRFRRHRQPHVDVLQTPARSAMLDAAHPKQREFLTSPRHEPMALGGSPHGGEHRTWAMETAGQLVAITDSEPVKPPVMGVSPIAEMEGDAVFEPPLPTAEQVEDLERGMQADQAAVAKKEEPPPAKSWRDLPSFLGGSQ
jgi:hypothetical protein